MCESVKSNSIECKAERTAAKEVCESLMMLKYLANRVETLCYNRLTPVMLKREEKACIPGTASVPLYPPLFAEYRSKIQAVEIYLLRIAEMLKATEI